MGPQSINFKFLYELDPQYDLVGYQAERLLFADPAASIQKLRLLTEFLAERICAATSTATYLTDQLKRLQALRDASVLSPDAWKLFNAVRTAGNEAVHRNKGDLHTAQGVLRAAWQAAVFTRTLLTAGGFSPPKFEYPKDPDRANKDALAQLSAAQQEIDALRVKNASVVSDATATSDALAAARAALEAAIQKAEALGEERAFWEGVAQEFEAKHNAALDALRKKVAATPGSAEGFVANAARAAASIALSEAEVRESVDADLRRAGWTADSTLLRWSLGVRPEAGKALAIAEVPTGDGVADYVLFDGLDAMAVVEAKAATVDVSGALEQAKRYARAFPQGAEASAAGGPWGDCRVPFAFATNGREFFPQLPSRSGIWFADLHRADEAPRALAGWYTPAGLRRLLARDVTAAQALLTQEPTDYLGLRDYQLEAIARVEEAIASGRRRVLLAMATGTGKTRTCLGLIYRLLKSRRFHRVLFVVDRAALADQAWEVFSSAKLEAQKPLTEIYDVKGLAETEVEPDTRLHIVTVQGLIRRILFAERPEDVPPTDQYDCIVVDECHRGYVLDAEMSETEMLYRSEDDYLSKYRRAIEHFDAVAVGLTATPALHTTQIFGRPVFQYRFRDAVIDGWLMDQEPVIRIRTELNTKGVHLRAESTVQRWDPKRGKVETDVLPDAVSYGAEDFNQRVLVPSFNAVVCEEIVRQIDPMTPGKTLVFCVNDQHADDVVACLRAALASIRGITDPDVVAKITGRADKPLRILRRFRLERLPDIAVTVDLLTTGVDVPEITALVFLRAVRSRILYEQMLGRATRPCGEIGKTAFKVFDAVGVTEALQPFSAMNPVARDPSFTFTTLAKELDAATTDAVRDDVLGQIMAKLRARASRLGSDEAERFRRLAGDDADAVLSNLRAADLATQRAWWSEHRELVAWLDAPRTRADNPIVVDTADAVLGVEQRVSAAPVEEYLDGFGRFLREQVNLVPALQIIVQRPRELTRAVLKEVRALLDANGYGEPKLNAAWKQARNAEIAAGIIGYVRQRAIGAPLVAYELRVDAARDKVLASRPWTGAQRQWIERIALQMKQETVVDRAALDSGTFAAYGGARRIDAIFEGQTDAILGDLLEATWQDAG